MKKKEMISKLLRYNGIGVRVTTITGFTDYLFYEITYSMRILPMKKEM